MRIIFALVVAVAAFAFGKEQSNELLAEDSRALLAAGRRHRFGGFGRGLRRGGGGGGMAGPPAEGGGESDVAADIPGGRPPFGRGFPGGLPMGRFGGRFGGGPPGGAGAPQDGGQAEDAGRLLTAMGRRGGGRRGGRGGGRRGGRGGRRRGGGRRGRHL
ncbi:hypothetical protein LEN26_004682 [Aphanomyces euteiches]|nr:hypothetical protein LEN26_020269 [Aphanomyces euteiches]KAH9088666.1 hypothetical protein LEN26_019434 [Aphanomyces euteiches]KAH9113993.1 hypothetical protein AeMF1_011890 [Aphanomyces euteiches]KAH9147666.1 hypothetical protein LEN26_004682 [Aphanomyces euteiches]